jgi:hypothetical protein
MKSSPSRPGPDLASGEWWLEKTPFRHFRAHDVLSPADYERVATAFTQTMADGATAGGKGKTANYDADILGLTPVVARLFDPFFSDPWVEAMHRAMLIPDIHRVDGALHSSAPGSRTGWIHTDFCSAWFDESKPASTTPIFPNRAACDYFTGKAKSASARPKEYVRAATMIYFLCNDGWQAGDGGETGLYATAHGHGPELVRPVNNSLVFFRCSPHSYHRFVTNPGRTRNSIILWIHETVEAAVSTWGPRAVHRTAA